MRRPHEVIAAVLVAAGFAFGQNPRFRIEGELVMSPAKQVFAVADLDGDGHPDLVAADPNGILLNDGNGSFGPLGIPNTAVTDPFDLYQSPILTAADFDGNGTVDIVAYSGSSWPPILTLHRNSGTGAFTPSMAPLPSAPGLIPLCAAAGDVDSDGDVDLVVGFQFQNGAHPIAVWLNDGFGSFTNDPARATTIPVPAWRIRLADVTGDYQPDLIAVDGSSGYPPPVQLPRRIFVNVSGSFATIPIVIPGHDSIDACDVGDFDGDGIKDLVFGPRATVSDNPPTSPVEVYRGLGGGAFAPATSIVPNQFCAPVFVDVDGNGDDELALVTTVGVEIRDVTVQAIGPPLQTVGEFAFIDSVCLPFCVDVDGDGDRDLLLPTRQGIRILFNGGNGTLIQIPSPILVPSQRVFGGVFADVNGDGVKDFVDAGATSSGMGVRVSWGTGTGSFLYDPAYTSPPGFGVNGAVLCAFDADGDGHEDVLVSLSGTTWSADTLLMSTPSGFVPGPSFATWGDPNVARAADLDGNGMLDLVVSRTTSPYSTSGLPPSYVVLNYGLAGWSPKIMLPPAATKGLVVADLDLNGWPDIVEANEFGPPASGSRIIFSPSATMVPFTPQVNGQWAEAGDLDGDQDVDLVIGRRILLNQGTGAFVNASALSGSPSLIYPSAAALGDVDADGDLDVVEAQGFLHRNAGNGTFLPPETLPLTSKTAPILRDLDLDGDLDLVVSGPRVLKNVTRQLSRGLPARLGRVTSLELGGSPGAAWALFAGAPATPFAVAPYGFVQVDLSTVAQLSAGVFPPNGHSTFAVALQNSPALLGLSGMTQAVIFEPTGPRVTGAEWVLILSF